MSVKHGRDVLLTKQIVHGPHKWPRSLDTEKILSLNSADLVAPVWGFDRQTCSADA